MDMWMDVDTAVVVPVNVLPLLDDTDFKTIEDAIAYNAAGMDLRWNFVTCAGAYTSTAVTPTTGGAYDWAHQGDGMYSIEIPASGGASINNDTEGFGWFSGKATGVLPWRGPVIGFRRAALNDLLIDGGTASTNLEDFFDGTGYAGGTAKLGVDVISISGDTTAADNCELMFDGTGYAGGTTKLGVNLVQILGTALTETAGQIAAAFKKWFDVATPTGTVNSLPDAVPGAANGVFIAGTNAATTVTTALTTTFTGNLTGSVATVAANGITATSIAADAINAASVKADAVTKIQNGLATPTNITAGTITTVTNLTNAPTNGDLTATMKTSVTTACTASTPTAAAVTGAVGSVTGAVGSVTGNVGGNVTGSVGSLATQAKADVNAEVVDALNVDTYSEPGQGALTVTPTIRFMLHCLYKRMRNGKEFNKTTGVKKFFADDGTTCDQKLTAADDGTTYSETEIASGP